MRSLYPLALAALAALAAGCGGRELGSYENADAAREAEASDAPAADVPLADAEVAPSPFAPAGRVNALELPASLEAAQALGCDIVGAKGGSGLSPIGAFVGAGGLNELVTRREDASIGLVLLLQAHAFESAPGRMALRAYYGETVPDAETFTVDVTSLLPDGAARNAWPPAEVSGSGAFRTAPVTFVLTLTLGPPAPPINLILEHTAARGTVALAPPGVSFSETYLEGYLTRESILTLIEDVRTACGQMPPPDFCAGLRNLLDPTAPAERTLNVVLAIIGGYDAALDAAGPRVCQAGAAGDCNAIGVCLKLGAEAVAVEGLTPAP